MSSMCIVFILPDLPLSGAATRTVHIAEHLVGEGNRVMVCTLLSTLDKSLAERLRQSGIEVQRLGTIRGFRRVHKLAGGPVQTVIHSAMPTAGVAGLLLARIYR